MKGLVQKANSCNLKPFLCCVDSEDEVEEDELSAEVPVELPIESVAEMPVELAAKLPEAPAWNFIQVNHRWQKLLAEMFGVSIEKWNMPRQEKKELCQHTAPRCYVSVHGDGNCFYSGFSGCQWKWRETPGHQECLGSVHDVWPNWQPAPASGETLTVKLLLRMVFGQPKLRFWQLLHSYPQTFAFSLKMGG